MNPKYTTSVKVDQLLFSWLLLTINQELIGWQSNVLPLLRLGLHLKACVYKIHRQELDYKILKKDHLLSYIIRQRSKHLVMD